MIDLALTVKLPEFEGPLDLLLHLIKKSEMNIYDIPIVAITSQYLEYLHHMQASRLEVAGDYFVMAATLMRIKSQTLLPREPTVELTEDEDISIDPRDELVNQLLVYQTYKKAATDLQQKELVRKTHFSKAPSLTASAEPLPMPKKHLRIDEVTAALVNLLQGKVVKPVSVRNVVRETITIKDKVRAIIKQLQQNKRGIVDFDDLLNNSSVEETVTTFMSVLELMKNGQVSCYQEAVLTPITVALKESKA
ncbi:segregation/condensation protein A [Loigolactobacillus backii]|nr:segregation/condensation protein A [Loigolactobacillus backii]MDA5387263.1 segregation/condensation protein A [Loigolactobacillus backii]